MSVHRPCGAALLVLALLAAPACGAAQSVPASAPSATTPSVTTTAGEPEADGPSCWTISPNYAAQEDGSLGGEASPEAALELWAAGAADAGAWAPIDPGAWMREDVGQGVVFTQGTWSATFIQAPAGDWVLGGASGCS